MVRDDTWSLRVFSAGVLCVFAAVALAPVFVALAGCFHACASVLNESRQWTLLGNTLAIAAGAALLAAAIGAPLGIAVGYLRVPTRGGLERALVVPLLIPPYVTAVVWAELLSRRGLLRYGLDAAQNPDSPVFPIYSIAGVIVVLALSYFPIVALATLAAFRRYDRRVEDAARLVAGPWRVFGAIALPLAAPAILTGTLLVFLLALVEFSVPSLLQVNVYTVEIYSRFSTSYDGAQAAAQALPLLIAGTIVLVLWWTWLRPRYGRLTGSPSDARENASPRAWPIAVLCWLVLAAAVGLPALVLVWKSLPPSTYLEVWKTAKEEIATSLILAGCSATALTLLALAMAFLARENRPSARLYPASVAAFLVSGPILGVGLIRVWNHAGPCAWVYDSPAILVLACTARGLGFAYFLLHAALRDVPRALDEAAAVAGVSWARRLIHVIVPLTAPALIATWGLGFVFALRELDTAVLVAPPGWTPLSVRLFSLMHYGPSAFVAALCVITIGAVFLAAAGCSFLHRKARRSCNR